MYRIMIQVFGRLGRIAFLMLLLRLPALAAIEQLEVRERAGEFHAILVCHTDEMGRPDRKATYERFAHDLEKIADSVDMIYREHAFTGSRFDYNELVGFLQDFESGPDDTVMLVYDGHGGNVAGSEWPYFRFPDRETLPMDRVIEALRDTHPRLLIVLSGACNAEELPEGGDTITTKANATPPEGDYRALFMEAKGEILGTAAQPGEVSWGAIYPNTFLDMLHAVARDSDSGATWHKVMARTYEGCVEFSRDMAIGEYRGPQHPVSRLNLTSDLMQITVIDYETKQPKASFCYKDKVDVLLTNTSESSQFVTVINVEALGEQWILFKGYLQPGTHSLSDDLRKKHFEAIVEGRERIFVHDANGEQIGEPVEFRIRSCY